MIKNIKNIISWSEQQRSSTDPTRNPVVVVWIPVSWDLVCQHNLCSGQLKVSCSKVFAFHDERNLWYVRLITTTPRVRWIPYFNDCQIFPIVWNTIPELSHVVHYISIIFFSSGYLAIIFTQESLTKTPTASSRGLRQRGMILIPKKLHVMRC